MEIQSMDLRKQVLQLRAVNFLHGLASSVMNFRVLYLSGIGLTATQSGICYVPYHGHGHHHPSSMGHVGR